MQQYANPSAAANQQGVGTFNANRSGVGLNNSNNASGVRPNAAPTAPGAGDGNTTTPNYFNGTYSRSRL
jgi:hypothetical protein